MRKEYIYAALAGFIVGAFISYGIVRHVKNQKNEIMEVDIIIETPVSPEASESGEIKKEIEIDIVPEVAAKEIVEKASYYCEGFEGNTTANMEIYDCEARTCAHKSLPFDTEVEITAENGNVTTCRVNDRGPYKPGRVFDLSPVVFQELAPLSAGLVTIKSWRVL